MEPAALAEHVLDVGRGCVGDVVACGPPADVAVHAVVTEPQVHPLELEPRDVQGLIDGVTPDANLLVLGNRDAAHGAHDGEHQPGTDSGRAHSASRIDCSDWA